MNFTNLTPYLGNTPVIADRRDLDVDFLTFQPDFDLNSTSIFGRNISTYFDHISIGFRSRNLIENLTDQSSTSEFGRKYFLERTYLLKMDDGIRFNFIRPLDPKSKHSIATLVSPFETENFFTFIFYLKYIWLQTLCTYSSATPLTCVKFIDPISTEIYVEI